MKTSSRELRKWGNFIMNNDNNKAEQELLPTGDIEKYFKINYEREAKANEANAQINLNDKMKKISIRNRFNKNDWTPEPKARAQLYTINMVIAWTAARILSELGAGFIKILSQIGAAALLFFERVYFYISLQPAELTLH